MLPARDLYHDLVVNALVKDGWIITEDPLRLTWDTVNLFADLRARRARDPSDDIGVEIKSFIGRSEVADLEQALGQYLLYRAVLLALDSRSSCGWQSRKKPGERSLKVVLVNSRD